MPFASNPSCYGLQMPSERESVPMSNDHQPLPGDLNDVQWSEEDIANLIAAIQSGEASREVRAQSDALSVDTEDSLSMSNEYQPLPNVAQLSEEDISKLVAAIEDDESSSEVCAQSDALFGDAEDSVSMSNEYQPLPGNSNVVQWSEEDISKLIAAIQSGESSPEVRAQLDVFFNDTEDFLHNIKVSLLAGPADAHVNESNYDSNFNSNFDSNHDGSPAPQEEGSDDLEYVELDFSDPRVQLHRCKDFTDPVADLPQLPQSDPEPYCPPQPSAVPEMHRQDYARSQHEYNPGCYANAPPGAYHSQPSAVVQAPLQGYALPQHGYYPAPSYPYQQPQPVAGPSNANYTTAAFPQGQHAPLQTGSSGSTSMEPAFINYDCTTFTKPPKRKSCHTTKFGNTSSVPEKPQKRRCLDGNDSTQGKFGPYTLADAHATVMVMPVHDPNPVDISSRKTLDPCGKPLRTRRFGVMELDDCYVAANGYAAKNLSPGLTCVRLCEWDDHPCGLFIEMDESHIDQHMWYWHGVDARQKKKKITCQYEPCSATQAMKYLSRHVESVHFDTSFQCPYCMELCSRDDALRRHLRVCKALIARRNHAQNGGYEFHLQEMIPLFKGYIVPATSAT